MPFKWLKGGDLAQKRQVIEITDQPQDEVITECYCPNGHSVLTDMATFHGHPALTLKLRGKTQEGFLAISPVIGDRDRTFFDFTQMPGEIVEICCPECSEPFPVYNECPCGAHLVALFTSSKTIFNQCVGICQRLGCLHSELNSERDLRLFSRQDYL